MFDINLFPINIEQGVEQNSLPGLAALTPPRKTARGRENDVVIAMIQISGSSAFYVENFNGWLVKKLENYYKTAGTVTFAMKSLVDSLNSDLLERNLKGIKEGIRMSGALNLVVLRRESLYLVNIGPAKTWFAGSTEALEIADSDNQGRGLGVDQNLVCRFSTCELNENDTLTLSCLPPEIWKVDTFAGCNTLTNEAVSRRIYSQMGSDLKAVLLRFTNGKGQIRQEKLPGRAPVKMTNEKEEPETVIPEIRVEPRKPAAQVEPSIQTEPEPMPNVDWSIPTSEPEESDQVYSQTYSVEVSDNSYFEPSTEPVQIEDNEAPASLTLRRRTGTHQQPTKPVRLKPEGPSEAQVAAGKVTKGMVTGAKAIGSSVSSFTQKVLPGLADEPLKLGRGTLIAIAIAVPMLIALLAGAVYARSGKSKQFNQNLILAQQYAMQAELQVNDPPVYLASLQQSMFWLDKAESYGQTDSSASLRVKVQGELDILQGVQRLEMVEVIPGGLPAGSVVSQILATATDLYLLDSTSGTVKRYSMGSSGYQLDEAFNCGPDEKNPLNNLGKIVDMAAVDVNNTFKATILAVDGSGNIEFCVPGTAGITSALTQPDQGWKSLKSISIFNNYLYVLDIAGNAVYRYEGNGVQFENKPTLYFDNQIPALTEAIDIEVNGDELYILRSNGQMVECTYSHMKDYKLTECLDPAPYGDMRTGQEPAAINFPEAKFVQMRMTAAPDSSIYLLDATGKAMYHFSLQRNLQKILHPRFVDGVNLDRVTPTAVAVSSARIVFLAFGSQIYYAPLP
ncbi:MAG: hypothetical protein CVU42_04360 [Chloroflexi bacterium HGW-Chloroflexi-4]|nr:MAG: hypothetical protein CVU42_04360 [Chloroflexi bacterium HGW-Chloroflexi-4]